MLMGKRARVVDIDDGGSFQRLVQKAQEALQSSEDQSPAQVINLVELEVIRGFVNRVRRDAMHQNLQQTNNDLLACFIPKKKRGSCSGRDTSSSSSSSKISHSLHVFDREDDHYQQKGSEKKRNKSKKKSIVVDGSQLAMPSILRRRIEEKGGNEIKLVIIKQVYQTDVSKHHDRLSIPINQIRDPSFLKGEETAFLAKSAREKKENKGIDVKLMEPCGVESEMVFVKWELKSSDSYALRTSWNNVLKRNYFIQNKYFDVNDTIQLWSFRVEGRLWFALTKVGDESSHNAAASTSYANLQEED